LHDFSVLRDTNSLSQGGAAPKGGPTQAFGLKGSSSLAARVEWGILASMANSKTTAMKLLLREDKLLETVEIIRAQIDERFPNSGLSRIAGAIAEITRESLARAAAISRPNFWLRAGLALLLVFAVVAVVVYLKTSEDQTLSWQTLVQFFDASKGNIAVLSAIAVFLVTLETRLKRRRALQAMHELRAVAHIIDMHQLSKGPDRLGRAIEPVDSGGIQLDNEGMRRYLRFCTVLLAVISKVGQVYVQDFPDPAAQLAVDNFESLATGLSSKIWQKLMILDRIQSDAMDKGAEVRGQKSEVRDQKSEVRDQRSEVRSQV
jgi:hypothetical protein